MNNNGILTINTTALAENYNYVKSVVNNSKIAVMLKANAYGVGYKEVFKTGYEQGARDFFVAYLSEAIELKNFASKNDISIYILQDLNKDNYQDFIDNDFIPVLNTSNNIKLWSDKAKNKKCIIHFDSGINRLGLTFDEIKELDFSNLNIDYIMTHFAEAEVENSEYTEIQYNNFQKALKLFPKDIKISISNSSGAFNTTHHFDMIRVGACLYGINPTPNKNNLMKEIISLKARIVQIKKIKTGEKVGYNGKYVAPTDKTIALIGEGHADTITRAYGNNGFVFFNNIKLPIIGNISMDLTAIDISEIESTIEEGNYVEIIGENQSLEKFAQYSNTIGYEILTLLGRRYNKESR